MKKLLLVLGITGALLPRPAESIEPMTALVATVLGWGTYKIYKLKQIENAVYRSFIKIIEQGNLDEIRQFSKKEELTFDRIIDKRCALSAACAINRLDIVKWMVRHGASLKSKGGAQALLEACKNGNKEIIGWLVANDVMAPAAQLYEALIQAVNQADVDGVDCLLQAGADPNATYWLFSKPAKRPLHRAVLSTSFDLYNVLDSVFHKLVWVSVQHYNGQYYYYTYHQERRFDPNGFNKQEYHTFKELCKRQRRTFSVSHEKHQKYMRIVQLLLDYGADFNYPNKEKLSAFYCAALIGNEKAMKMMHEKGGIQIGKKDHFLGRVPIQRFLKDLEFLDLIEAITVMESGTMLDSFNLNFAIKESKGYFKKMVRNPDTRSKS